ncbi:M12 family metallo-peptidase [Gilvimarinus sp. SDUM040013]|uniref:M12 family metallo-peptidase n=1 Tax=Gilvimarinus gilvus TaxID=3058038 RepID=A0ABU4S191_9GAMM|nr:M12 family metallo-peptidase [Gilvimarinus sp. SDUM040013]MDO3385374.1 M12 family metallo-peptidase [Gilvimarinus sp. SDUM040013]MDX6850949.1 M12 family metallo-peptidase [Gilvimarinus sp. SDUM040013]
MKKVLFAAIMVFGVAVGPAAAQPPEIPSLISPVTGKNGAEFAKPAVLGVRHINYNSALARSSLSAGSPVRVPLPDGTTVILNFEKRKRNPSGSMTWVGQLAGASQHYKAIITDDGEHVFGRILTPDGEYLLRTVSGVQELVNPRTAGMEVLSYEYDEAMPPARSSRSADPRAEKSTPVYENAGPTDVATIDVLLAYSTGLATELGAGLQARLDYLIAVANQAYEDSGIYQRLRVVHTVEVAYSDTESNSTALYALTPAFTTPASLSDLPTLRNTYGADLVALIRRYQYPEHSGCGVAWVNGFNNAGTVVGDDDYGYSVTSDGLDYIDGGPQYSFCSDLTLAHELGHNMGSTHDRDHTSTNPVFSYSYGHGFDQVFGTVMSYYNPEVTLFSTPNIDCDDQLPCGIADPDPDAADNVRSINNVRFEVAAFRDTVVPEGCTPEETLTLENASVPGVVTETSCAIEAGPSYVVTSTADVTFNANESITLHPGFRVETGGQFAANVTPAP